MITHTEVVAYVENNDWLKGNDDRPDCYVYSMADQGDLIVLDLVDEEGEHYPTPMAPFDTVTVIDRWEDNEEIPVPDVEEATL
jgi:hypothetical protein